MDAVLLDAAGRPLASRPTVPKACPGCGAGPERRDLSGGFGEPHDVCVVCGHEFTLAETQRR